MDKYHLNYIKYILLHINYDIFPKIKSKYRGNFNISLISIICAKKNHHHRINYQIKNDNKNSI